MEKKSWGEFREKYPDLADRVLTLGATIYEMGAERACNAPELSKLVTCIADAPEEAKQALGITERSISKAAVLEAIFEKGSSLLLDYVQNGTC